MEQREGTSLLKREPPHVERANTLDFLHFSLFSTRCVRSNHLVEGGCQTHSVHQSVIIKCQKRLTTHHRGWLWVAEASWFGVWWVGCQNHSLAHNEM